MSKIDFVITWVDGADEQWLKERAKYDGEVGDKRISRYRELGILKYWFRAVEKYAPWVNKIYFVTCGQIPKWMNTENPKLVIVKHSDYMPNELLPTYNSVPIELYLNRIEGLSNNFVYFNDDMMLNAPVKEKDFFKNDKPCDTAVLSAITPSEVDDLFSHCLLSDAELLDKRYDIHSTIKKNLLKWFNPRYGAEQVRTLLLLPWHNFTGLKMHHMPISYTKDTLERLWREERKKLEEATKDRFRNNYKINHWVFRYEQILSGNFSPRNPRNGKLYLLEDEKSARAIAKNIKKAKKKFICINDGLPDNNYEVAIRIVLEEYEKKFKEKSTFEK